VFTFLISPWFDAVEGEPAYHVMTEEEITTDVSAGACEEQGSEEETEEETTGTHNLSEVRDALGKVVNFISVTANKEVQLWYQHFWTIRELVVCTQQNRFTQLKMDVFHKTAFAQNQHPLEEPGHKLNHHSRYFRVIQNGVVQTCCCCYFTVTVRTPLLPPPPHFTVN
jgi:hypothetical protein